VEEIYPINRLGNARNVRWQGQPCLRLGWRSNYVGIEQCWQ